MGDDGDRPETERTMNCKTCGHRLTPLLVSAVCDRCDGKLAMPPRQGEATLVWDVDAGGREGSVRGGYGIGYVVTISSLVLGTQYMVWCQPGNLSQRVVCVSLDTWDIPCLGRLMTYTLGPSIHDHFWLPGNLWRDVK